MGNKILETNKNEGDLMAEPQKKPRRHETPDIEAQKRQRRAEEVAKESEEEIVERAVEKRFLQKQPPRKRD